MIELQRAKLGLPPAGSSPAAPIHNSSTPSRSGSNSHALASGAGTVQQTPQQAAAAAVRAEEIQMQRFIHRLQRRDDSHPVADATCGPTVPTALSRRILQRQGVGYLDDTVAAITSAAADRFLATVLQQAVACRDQRLKGAEMAREAARHRKRHMQHYEADTADRKRQKEENDDARENSHLATIAAADALRKGGGAKDSDDKKKKKKKKKPEAVALTTNGKKPDSFLDDGEDDNSYDSIDEEEEYYEEQLGKISGNLKKDEDEDPEDMLILRDLVRPLEAWDFHVTGKTGLEVREPDSDDEEDNEEKEDQAEKATSQHLQENGNDDGEEGMDAFFKNYGGEQVEESEKAPSSSAKRKAASSPVPNAS
jgi:hypothetical protein